MILVLVNAINLFFRILTYLVLGRAILSWFIRGSYNSNLYKAYNVIIQITEPILAPCRSLLARFGMNGAIDFSPILAIVGLNVINGIIINLIRMFML